MKLEQERPETAEKLATIAEFVREEIPDHAFNMAVILKCRGYDAETAMRDALGDNKCGAVGCVYGFMPLIFPEDLCYLNGEPWVRKQPPTDAGQVGDIMPSWLAMTRYLGLSLAEADYLFMPESYETGYDGDGECMPVTRQNVVLRIRRVLRTGFPVELPKVEDK